MEVLILIGLFMHIQSIGADTDLLTGHENDEIHHQQCTLTYAFCWQTFFSALTDQ